MRLRVVKVPSPPPAPLRAPLPPLHVVRRRLRSRSQCARQHGLVYHEHPADTPQLRPLPEPRSQDPSQGPQALLQVPLPRLRQVPPDRGEAEGHGSADGVAPGTGPGRGPGGQRGRHRQRRRGALDHNAPASLFCAGRRAEAAPAHPAPRRQLRLLLLFAVTVLRGGAPHAQQGDAAAAARCLRG